MGFFLPCLGSAGYNCYEPISQMEYEKLKSGMGQGFRAEAGARPDIQ